MNLNIKPLTEKNWFPKCFPITRSRGISHKYSARQSVLVKLRFDSTFWNPVFLSASPKLSSPFLQCTFIKLWWIYFWNVYAFFLMKTFLLGMRLYTPHPVVAISWDHCHCSCLSFFGQQNGGGYVWGEHITCKSLIYFFLILPTLAPTCC